MDGRTDGRMDGRTDGRTECQKLCPSAFLRKGGGQLITLYKRNAYWTFTYISLHLNGSYFDFYNSEVMTSLPHNLVLDS